VSSVCWVLSHRSLGCCIWFLFIAQLSCLPSGSSLNWSQRGSGLDFGRHSNLLVTYLPHKQIRALAFCIKQRLYCSAYENKSCCFWCELWSAWACLVHCHNVLSPALSMPQLFFCVCVCVCVCALGSPLCG